MTALIAPFPYFGGKRTVSADVWARLGAPKQYIEPFCGSAAMLLAAPSVASLEVVNDANGFIANFWRAVKNQPEAVAEWCDYPVSHIDLGARHKWLREHREELAALSDPDWPGDAKIAGWWLWGQCCWIGAGWCDERKNTPDVLANLPHASSAGRGVQAVGQIPHASDAGRGVQAVGKIPHASDAGMGTDELQTRHDRLLTSCGRTAWRWLRELANRLERVRITHGDWSRCLNSHYGGKDTAVFLDPPYRSFGTVYGATGTLVADECEAWARDNAGGIRVALCGHRGDYNLDGWTTLEWSRGKATYSGSKTTDEECIWFSPACLSDRQGRLL